MRSVYTHCRCPSICYSLFLHLGVNVNVLYKVWSGCLRWCLQHLMTLIVKICWQMCPQLDSHSVVVDPSVYTASTF